MDKKGIFNLTIAVLLLIIVPVVVLREYQVLKPKKTNYETPLESAQERHSYSNSRDKEFVFVVFSTDGEPFSSQNMHSIFDQSYRKYRIVFMNVGSDTRALDSAKEYVRQQGSERNVQFVQCYDVHDFYGRYSDVITHCRDDEIVIQMDGRDWLANESILETLNEAYEDPDVWLTYGEYLEYPSYRKGRMKEARSTKRATIPWFLSRFKTFYAGLFKEIDSSALPGDGSFLLPMVEMAKWHVRFIPDVLYVRSATACGDELSLSAAADCLIVSDGDLLALDAVLRDVQEKVLDVATVSVVAPPSVNRVLYSCMQERHPRVSFGLGAKGAFAESLIRGDSSYVLLISDQAHIEQSILVTEYVEALEEADALAVFFAQQTVQANEISSVPYNQKMYAKKGVCGVQSEMTLYRKETLIEHVANHRCKTTDHFMRSLEKAEIEDVALFCF